MKMVCRDDDNQLTNGYYIKKSQIIYKKLYSSFHLYEVNHVWAHCPAPKRTSIGEGGSRVESTAVLLIQDGQG
ncbi:hypothetical protein WA1_43515 [Scytonema hofmannii PCC 7110]|uniref:Uncharacterized protein n=1 Tax=Scytonema hofmannii PCC 7110 TaxID=128403 RepID=A0A139WVU7_9CYAN|nr:hypothetical protein WA1_43515 [Scytonema hofmannii PCC 7110]